jgi:hypothetical protein
MKITQRFRIVIYAKDGNPLHRRLRRLIDTKEGFQKEKEKFYVNIPSRQSITKI